MHPKGTIALAIRAIIRAIRTNYMRSSQSLICQNINSIPKTARDQRRQQERDSQVSKSSRNGYNFAKSALARLSRYSLLEPRGKSAGLGLGGGAGAQWRFSVFNRLNLECLLPFSYSCPKSLCLGFFGLAPLALLPPARMHHPARQRGPPTCSFLWFAYMFRK